MAEKRTEPPEEVIASIRAGRSDAFRKIIEEYQAPITRYLYRLTGDHETALDLAQETFIKAYKGILKTAAEINLKPWLYRIATNNARQYHRRRMLLSFIRFDDLRNSGAPEIEEQTENRDDGIAIQETLRKLPAEQRVCMVLHLVEGFKYREIAETLGISEDAVRMRVSRGKEIFRRVYNGGKTK